MYWRTDRLHLGLQNTEKITFSLLIYSLLTTIAPLTEQIILEKYVLVFWIGVCFSPKLLCDLVSNGILAAIQIGTEIAYTNLQRDCIFQTSNLQPFGSRDQFRIELFFHRLGVCGSMSHLHPIYVQMGLCSLAWTDAWWATDQYQSTAWGLEIPFPNHSGKQLSNKLPHLSFSNCTFPPAPPISGNTHYKYHREKRGRDEKQFTWWLSFNCLVPLQLEANNITECS